MAHNIADGLAKKGSSTAQGQQPEPEPWDLDGDGKLSKVEADIWGFIGNGAPITVDNKNIDWTGLEMNTDTNIMGNPIDGDFSITTTQAFEKLPFETSSTYGGTSFVRTGTHTANVLDQDYHYNLRDWNSFENIARNLLTQAGNPSNLMQAEFRAYRIHFKNPEITFSNTIWIQGHYIIPHFAIGWTETRRFYKK